MASKWNIKSALTLLGLAVEALDVIEDFTDLGGDKAEAALAAIKAVIARLKDGFEGRATPEEVDRELLALTTSLGSTDARIDAILAAKFKSNEQG